MLSQPKQTLSDSIGKSVTPLLNSPHENKTDLFGVSFSRKIGMKLIDQVRNCTTELTLFVQGFNNTFNTHYSPCSQQLPRNSSPLLEWLHAVLRVN